MKDDIIYYDGKILVSLNGTVSSTSYKKLKKKLNYIMNEYQINDIVIDIKNGIIDYMYLNDLEESFNHITLHR